MVVQSSQIKLKDLCVTLDPDLSFDEHIKTVSRTPLLHLHNIAKIIDILSKNDADKWIHAFVTSRLDCCNLLLSTSPDKALNKLQLVINTAARILTRTKRIYHIPVLASLHWLPVKATADFKVLLLTLVCLSMWETHTLFRPLSLYWRLISSVGHMIECSLVQECEGDRKDSGATNRPCCLCLAGSPLSTGILCL